MFKLKIFLVFTLVLYFTINSLFLFSNNVLAANLFDDNFENPTLTSNNWLIYGNSGWNIDSGWYRIALSPGLSNAIPNDSVWDTGWTNIRYELDLIGQAGVDKNILVKFVDESNFLEFHANDQGIILEKGSNLTGGQVLDQSPQLLQNDVLYHFRIDVKNNNDIKVYINDTLTLQGIENIPLTGWRVGLRAGSGGAGIVNVRFDNVVVTELPDDEEETLPVLTVPDLKQYSLPWKNKVYDHKNASIEKFGCALTAASMVLQYHGHNIMPDVLNNWLKNQPDGYLKNGLINWLAISRYTKENYSPQSRTLEYKRLDPTNENLDSELNNDRPAILKEPGHFVVATGKTTDSYLINDPGYADRTDLSSYGNSFLKINSYTPTDSDLSYMMFVTDPDIDLEVASSSGLILPIDSFVEDPITNLLNPDKKSGNPVKIYLFEKPETGKYTLKATGPKGKYNLESYLYNIDGKVTKNSYEGRLKEGEINTFNINYENKKKKSSFWFWHKFFSEFFENHP